MVSLNRAVAACLGRQRAPRARRDGGLPRSLQGLEGFTWLAIGNYDLTTTQLKETSMLSPACSCALIALAAGLTSRRFASCVPLVRLGDLSFGVYLCHMMVLTVFRRVFEIIGLSGFAPSFFLWIATLVTSAVFIVFCQHILPKRALAAIGFA